MRWTSRLRAALMLSLLAGTLAACCGPGYFCAPPGPPGPGFGRGPGGPGPGWR